LVLPANHYSIFNENPLTKTVLSVLAVFPSFLRLGFEHLFSDVFWSPPRVEKLFGRHSLPNFASNYFVGY